MGKLGKIFLHNNITEYSVILYVLVLEGAKKQQLICLSKILKTVFSVYSICMYEHTLFTSLLNCFFC